MLNAKEVQDPSVNKVEHLQNGTDSLPGTCVSSLLKLPILDVGGWLWPKEAGEFVQANTDLVTFNGDRVRKVANLVSNRVKSLSISRVPDIRGSEQRFS